LSCADPAAIGAPFTLVSFVPGAVLRTQADLATLSGERLKEIHGELIRVVALLQSLPYESLGLADFGRSEGFVTRQIKRWREQWDHVATREFDDVDRLYKALVRSPPAQTRSR